MKAWAKWFYKGTKWKKTRRAYFIQQFGICERCQGANGSGKIVHHKIYLTPDNIKDTDISLSFDNLELLCHICHNKEHFKEYTALRDGFMFDANGDLVRSE